ncbi:hypothetical protein ACFOYW_04515 [Gryllotalpicola reticulitermitis]|uniref:Uncharacterized protein n=1 Tax=Gryllotalpicola reticulitermitis TaxID=1184153 RepID=A0ABV8Q3U9_9MICO
MSPEHWALTTDRSAFQDPAQRHRAALRHEIDIAVEWGRQEEPHDETGWWVPWARERIVTEVCDVWWRGAPIDRVILARVGGRALLPLPLPAHVELLVSEWEVRVARLAHDLEGLGGFEELLNYTDIQLIAEWPAEMLDASR